MTRTLVECLKLFNRKERYWLIRNALGEKGEELPLSKSFRDSVKAATGIDIPTDAWWALDYHIDWLFGALVLDSKLDGSEATPMGNPNRLIRGTQEDFDFIIAFDRTIILVEAKGVTGWDPNQMSKKCERLKEWSEFAPMVQSSARDGYVPPRMTLALTSTTPHRDRFHHLDWPALLNGGDKKLPHMTLDLFGDTKRFLAPTRCNSESRASSKHGLWHVTVAK